MKRIKCFNFNLKFFLSILLIFAMFSTNLTVYADPEGNGADSSGGIGGKNAVVGGASENKSGYLAYVTNESGGIASDVVFIPYGSGASFSVNAMRARYTNTPPNRMYGGNMASATNGEFTSPPFSFSGGTFGGKLKNWMITKGSDDHYNVFNFLLNVFGMSGETFINGDLVLHVEGVAISRISSSAPGVQYAYTAYTIAKLYEAGVARDTQLNSFFLNRLQTCAYLEKSWAGLKSPSGDSLAQKASNTSGFGLIQIRAKDLVEEPEEPDVVEAVEFESDDFILPNCVNVTITDMIPDDSKMRKFDHYETTLVGSYPGTIESWDNFVPSCEERDVVTDDYGNSAIRHYKSIILGWYEDESQVIQDYKFYTSDLTDGTVNEFGHYLWCEPSLAPDSEYEPFVGTHTWDLDTRVCPGFGYNWSKKAAGENLIITTFLFF